MKKQQTIVSLALLIMRFSVLQILLAFLFSGLVIASPERAVAQTVLDEVISIHAENRKVKDVLHEIERSIRTKFTYNPQTIPVNEKVSLALSNEKLSAVLDHLLSPFEVQYEVSGEYIILSRPGSGVDVGQTLLWQPGDISIRGRVTEEGGEPLPGVNVLIKGTTVGTTTDAEGRYALDAPDEESILVFSFIGYVTREVLVGSQTVIDIALAADVQALEEVVVVGYGTMKKSDVTGAVGSVTNSDIVRTAPTQSAGAIQGQVAGVNVLKVNGKPGDDYAIDIRGLSSIGKSNEPLVVIDGVMGGSLNALNPADIEKVDVLKDASATAIYGSRGANGVIIITTRQGKSGKNVISYDGYYGVKTPTNLPDMMDGPQFVAYVNEAIKNGSSRTFDTKEQENIANGTYTDWIDLLLQNGVQTSHNVSLSGGGENSTHFFSAGYLSEEGNVPEEKFERLTLKANVDGRINDWIKTGVSTYFSYSLQDQGSNEALRGAYRVRPTGNAYDENGELLFWPTTSDSQTPNPLFDPKNVKNEFRNFRVFGNVFLEINPLKNLRFRTVFSPFIESVRNGQFTGKFSKANTGTRNGRASYSNRLNISYTLDNILSYDKTTKDHAFNGILANSLVVNRNEGASQSLLDLPFDSYWYNTGSAANIGGVSSYLTEWALLSYMARFNYSFKDRYQVTVTGRTDGSSKLAEGHKWAFFPSAAVAWRVSDESFLRDVNLFSNLKIRMSYGVVGNDAVAPYSTQASIAQAPYDWDGDAALGFAPGAIANRSLGWEKSYEFNVGVDFGFFQDRVHGSVDIYNRRTEDLILSRVLPPHTGFASIVGNIGSTLNKGVEVSLNTVNVNTGDFTWRTSINFSANHNEIVELYGDNEDDLGNQWFIGEPIRVLYDYVFDGIWQLDEADLADTYKREPGNVKVKDLNNDGKITPDDRTILGSPLPKWIGGITNKLDYKGFDFSFMIYTRQGAMVRSPFHHSNFAREWNGRYNKLNVNYWTETNPSNEWPAPNNTGGRVFEELKSYTDVSFVRVQNITLGYTFPATVLDRLQMSRLRLYVTANNPLIFTDYAGFDPEWAEQNTFNMGVSSSVYLMGVNLSF